MNRVVYYACFIGAGAVLASAGVTADHWQLYVVLGLMAIASFTQSQRHT